MLKTTAGTTAETWGHTMVAKTAYGLDMILNQNDLIEKSSIGECLGSFEATHGLPCCHTIKSLVQKNQVIPLEVIQRQ